MHIQSVLDSDIVMIFDECTPYPATEEVARASMELSLRWAERSKRAHEGNDAALFGIVQGGVHHDLRTRSAAGLQRRSASTATRSAAWRSASPSTSATRCSSTPARSCRTTGRAT